MHTVLIVDDDQKNRKIISAYLTKDNFIVFEADNANEAFHLLSTLIPDVILMDFQMPGLNGIETIEKIRETNSFTSIIMMTAYTSQEVVIGAIRSQADDFLSKPLNFKDLGNICRSVIEKRKKIFPDEEIGTSIINETLFSALVVSLDNKFIYVKDPIDQNILNIFNFHSFDQMYFEIKNLLGKLVSSIMTKQDNIVIQELRISKYYIFYYYSSNLVLFSLLSENQYNSLIEFEAVDVLESILKEIVEIVKSNNQLQTIKNQIDNLINEITNNFTFNDNL